MSAIDGFTEQQVAAIERAVETLGEHFEGALICVSTDVQHDGFAHEPTRIYWTGGYCRALGMAQYATHKMLRHYNQARRTPEDE